MQVLADDQHTYLYYRAYRYPCGVASFGREREVREMSEEPMQTLRSRFEETFFIVGHVQFTDTYAGSAQ